MSPRAVRFCAIPLAIFGAAWSVADYVWSPTNGYFLVPLLVTYGIYALLMWLSWRHRAFRLDARHGRYVADATPIAGMLLVASSTILGEQVQPNLLAPTWSGRLHEVPGALSHSWLLLTITFVIECAYVMENRPILWIDRTGVSIRRSWRTRNLAAWPDIAPGGAVVEHPLLSDRLKLMFTNEAAVRRSSVWVEVPTGGLILGCRALAAAIGYYVAHPESVPEIGTATDFALLADRTEPPPAEPNPMGAPA